MTPRKASDGAWSPLRSLSFRLVWSALLGTQVVVWMHGVGAAAAVAAASGSTTLIALVQTAISLPAVLLALVAGAAADLMDRRRLLVACQAWMLAAVAGLAGLSLGGDPGPAAVLLLTLALGAGLAASIPAYQALTPDLVSANAVPAAVTLNGVAINVARVAGPLLAGILIGGLSLGGLFVAEGAVLAMVVVALSASRPPRARAPAGPPERLGGAIRSGVRFIRFSASARAVLVRAAVFALCASALWALLPVAAFGPLAVGARGLGLLLGCAGAGAIAAAAALPRLRRRLSVDGVLTMGSLVLATALLALARSPGPAATGAAAFAAGAGWLAALSALNTAAQGMAPKWVRGRALAAFQLALQAGIALGSLGWGLVAEAGGAAAGSGAAGAGLVAGLAAAVRWPLAGGGGGPRPDAWPEPAPALPLVPADGPVLVTLEYVVQAGHAREFVAAMTALGQVRRRGGAREWGLYEDLGDPGRYIETFLVESWDEHLRQHRRLTAADLDVQRRATDLHMGTEPPRVRHLLAARAALRADPGAAARLSRG